MKSMFSNLGDIKELVSARSQAQALVKTNPAQPNAPNQILKIKKNPHCNPSSQSNFDSPGELFTINVSYITSFTSLLLEQSRNELDFHSKNAKELAKLQYETEIRNSRLVLIKHLCQFDCFTTVNKKENPSFLRPEAILERLKSLHSTLSDFLTAIKKEKQDRQITFFDEEECVKAFGKIIQAQFFEREYFRKVCSELYRFIRSKSYDEPDPTNIVHVHETLLLYIYGISFPTPNPEDYPLHKAVYTSNLPLIRRLVAIEKSPVFHCDVEQSDPAGITPLMLAVVTGNKDAVLILSNHGADPKHRSFPYARTPLEEAIQRKQRSMIKTLLIACNHLKQSLWESNKQALIKLLENIPDFTFEMGWECDSKIIPFVKRFAPSDNYKIYKRGDSLRIDLSLLGWKKLKSIRGNSSIIFNGKGLEGGRLTLVDHLKKSCVDVLSEMSSIELENKVDELMKHEQVNSEIKSDNVKFKPAKSWLGEVSTQKIEGYSCVKYNAKGTFSVLFTRRNILVEFDIAKFDSFEKYYACVMEEPLWSFDDPEVAKRSPLENLVYYMDNHLEVNGDDKGNSSTIIGTKNLTGQQKKLFKTYTKSIVAQVYLAENFPLNLDLLLPVLDILSNVSPQINRLKEFLDRKSTLNRTSFPLKAFIPIFFSVNAVISLKNFKFEPPEEDLFNFQNILQKTPRKLDDISSNEPRCRTEAGSDDENIQKCWDELFKNQEESDSEDLTKNPFKYQEDEKDDDEEEFDKTDKIIQSFFKKSKASAINHDLVNVYESEDEDCDVDDMSEKKKFETLKLSNHKSSNPKTIHYIEEDIKLSKLRLSSNEYLKTEPETNELFKKSTPSPVKRESFQSNFSKARTNQIVKNNLGNPYTFPKSQTPQISFSKGNDPTFSNAQVRVSGTSHKMLFDRLEESPEKMKKEKFRTNILPNYSTGFDSLFHQADSTRQSTDENSEFPANAMLSPRYKFIDNMNPKSFNDISASKNRFSMKMKQTNEPMFSKTTSNVHPLTRENSKNGYIENKILGNSGQANKAGEKEKVRESTEIDVLYKDAFKKPSKTMGPTIKK